MFIASSVLSGLHLRRRSARVLRRLRWLGTALLLVLLLGKLGLGNPAPLSPQTVFDHWRSHYQNQAYEEALESLQPIFESDNISGLNRALAYNYQALTQQKQGDLLAAENAIEQSWQLVEAERGRSNLDARQQRGLAAILNTRGQIQLALGQAQRAYDSWRQATAYYRQVGYGAGVTGGLLNQAQALQDLGFMVRACDTLLPLLTDPLAGSGQVSSCQHLQGKSEAFLRQWLGTMAFDETRQLQILVLQSFGNALRAMGHLTAAEMALRQAERQAEAIPGWDDRDLALALGNLYGSKARRYQQLGMFQEQFNQSRSLSLEYYRQAEGGTGEQRLRSQLNQVSLRVDLDLTLTQDNPNPDDESQAIVEGFLATLPPHIEQLPLSRDRVYARVTLACQVLICDRPDGETHLQEWDVTPTAIAQLLNMAQADAELLGDNRSQSYVLGALGRLAQAQGNLPQAQAYTERAIDLAEAIAADELLYRWNWQMAGLQEAQGLDSLEFYERAFDNLESLRFNLTALDPNIRFAFRDKIEPIYKEYAQRLLDRDSMSQQQLKQAIEVMDALQIAEISDFLGLACLEVRSRQLGEYPNTAVIYILTFSKRFDVILETPDGRLQRHLVEFDEHIETFLDSVQISLKNNFDYQESLRKLYQVLIEPIEAELSSLKPEQLAFVLYGKIRIVPIAALYDGEQYLIEKYPIAISPSLTLLEPRGLRLRDVKVLAAGRQNFETLLNNISDEDPFGLLRLEDFATINLNFVEQELDRIADLIKTRKIFGQNFTIETLERQIQSLNYPIVHIATHGRFSNFAEDTFIIADRPLGIRQLADILNVNDPTRRNDVDLLVLSACETAQESDRAVLGMAGIAAQSGVRTIIGSFWAVDDHSTALLMERFYQSLNALQNQDVNVNKAEALRQAMMAMIQGDFSENYTSPYFWAPFVLIGHWN